MLVGERQGTGGLLERDAELATVDERLNRAAAGEGGLLVLEGPAGIGKSRVLDACRAKADGRGFRTLFARGGELERDHAYGVVRQLFERTVATAEAGERVTLLAGPAAHAASALGIESPSAVGRAADDQSFAVRHGLYWLTANLAAGRPVLLAVDDTHWADAPSLRFLAYLAHRLEGLPVLLAMGVRLGEPPTDESLLAALGGDPSAQRVAPAPLSREATAILIGGDVAPEFAAACHAATGGNPFLVGELAAALARDGVDPVSANAPRVSALGPETVARALVGRIGRVSADAIALARAVAVLGASADPREAGLLAGLDEDGTRVAFDALVRAGVLAPERPARFVHPILRTAVYQDLPPAERDGMHARAAKLLRAAGAPPSEVAAHLLATVPVGSTSTAAALRDAARVALDQGAADLASRYLRRALEEPPPEADLGAVLAELGHAEWLAAEDPLAAIEHLHAALDLTADPSTRSDRTIALARAAFSVGDIPQARVLLEAELATAAGDGRTRDECLTLEAELGSVILLNQATPEWGDRLAEFAGLAGDSVPELLVLANLTAWSWMRHTADDTVLMAERALGGGRTIEAAGADAIAVLEVAWALAFTERHDLAEATLHAALADAQRTGSVFGLSATLALLSLVAYRQGEIVRAETEARRGISLPGLPPFAHPSIHTFLALALLERGELAEADAVMERSWVGPHLPLLAQMNCAFFGRGMVRLRQGRLEEARDDFLEMGRRDVQISIHNPGFAWRSWAARATAGLGDHDEAVRLADEQIDLARHWGTPGVIGAALHARALVGPSVDLDGLEQAAGVLAGSGARLDHAYAMIDLGAGLRAAGRRTEAREALRDGSDRARACGATALVHRAHDELVAAGAKPRRLQFSGVEALTASERRICELAAGGATNREIAQELFITPKTVENHLGRSYNKLGVSSREQLGEALGVARKS